MIGRVAAAAQLLAAFPVAAQVAAPPPEQAAGTALMQCVAHATGHGDVSAANAALLLANGLQYMAEPPPFLQSTRQTPYGNASYAVSPSAEGQTWLVGYDGPGNACLIFSVGTNVGPVEERLVKMLSIPGTWKEVPAAAPAAGERKREFQWKLKEPVGKVTALLSMRDLGDNAAKGMTMVTIARTAEK
jgi:hypothetical protein